MSRWRAPLPDGCGCAVVAFAGGTAAGLDGRSPRAALVAGAVALGGLARRRSALWAPCLVTVAFALGSWSAAVRAPGVTAIETAAGRVGHCALWGRVLEGAGGLGTLVRVDMLRCEGRGAISEPGVVVLDGAVGDAGSLLAARGTLLPLGRDGFGAARRRLGAGAYFEAADVRVRPPEGGIAALAAALHDGLVSSARSLPAERGALLRGLAVGDTNGLGEPVIEDFRRAGLAHLLAVSGSNVAIVVGAVSACLVRASLRVRVAVAAGALCLFVSVVGPEPSVLRAAAMGGIGLWGLACGRRPEPLHALGVALLAVVGLRPALVLSVGLHLSAAATAGIVLWSGPLARRVHLPRPAALGLAATLSAQVAVAPLLVATFGELSVAAPVSNLLAMPAVAPATIAGLAAAVAGAVYAPAGALAARAAEPFLAWILWVGARFGGAGWSSVSLPGWTGWAGGMVVGACALVTAPRPGRAGGGRS